MMSGRRPPARLEAGYMDFAHNNQEPFLTPMTFALATGSPARKGLLPEVMCTTPRWMYALMSGLTG